MRVVQTAGDPARRHQAHVVTYRPFVAGVGHDEGVEGHRHDGQASGHTLVAVHRPAQLFEERRPFDQP